VARVGEQFRFAAARAFRRIFGDDELSLQPFLAADLNDAKDTDCGQDDGT
jgi:hypothetical protein